MNEILLWVILGLAAVTAILVIVVLILAIKASKGMGREVREELRSSQEEAQRFVKKC